LATLFKIIEKRGDEIGKFLDGYKQLARTTRRLKLRQKYIRDYPWYTGGNNIIVVDALDMNSDQEYKAEIAEVGSGYSVGLMFELASRQIIKEIKCPKCGRIAKLNVHWQGFKCEDAVWELIRTEDR